MINSRLTSLIYPNKKITNDAILFKSIHYQQIAPTTKKPSSAAFKDYELSCDWNKYSTPEKSRDLIGRQYKKNTTTFKNKLLFFICGIYVNENLHLDPVQSFKHDPIYYFPTKKGFPNNQAHSLIIGNKPEKDALKARKKLADNSRWLIFSDADYELLLKENSK